MRWSWCGKISVCVRSWLRVSNLSIILFTKFDKNPDSWKWTLWLKSQDVLLFTIFQKLMKISKKVRHQSHVTRVDPPFLSESSSLISRLIFLFHWASISLMWCGSCHIQLPVGKLEKQEVRASFLNSVQYLKEFPDKNLRNVALSDFSTRLN